MTTTTTGKSLNKRFNEQNRLQKKNKKAQINLFTYHQWDKEMTRYNQKNVAPVFVIPCTEPYNSPECVQKYKTWCQESWKKDIGLLTLLSCNLSIKYTHMCIFSQSCYNWLICILWSKPINIGNCNLIYKSWRSFACVKHSCNDCILNKHTFTSGILYMYSLLICNWA